MAVEVGVAAQSYKVKPAPCSQAPRRISSILSTATKGEAWGSRLGGHPLEILSGQNFFCAFKMRGFLTGQTAI